MTPSPCPLPVDWLDYIEGQTTAELDQHLRECASCTLAVAALTAQDPELSDDSWVATLPVLEPVRRERGVEPSFGEFYFASGSPQTHAGVPQEALDAVVAVVIGDVFNEAGIDWVPVVFARTDVEEAVATDYVLDHDQNTLGAPWRLIFGQQDPIPLSQLSERIGATSGSGTDALQRALAGDGNALLWGSEFGAAAGADQLDRHWLAAVKSLRAHWARHLTSGAWEDTGLELTPSGSGDVEPSAKVSWLFLAHTREEPTALAAEGALDVVDKQWVLSSAAGVQAAFFAHASLSEGLSLRVRELSDALRGHTACLILVARPDHRWRSDPLVLDHEAHISVPLKVGPAEIQRLGLELVE